MVWIDDSRLVSDDWQGKVIFWAVTAVSFSQARTWSIGAQALGLAVSPDKTQIAVAGDNGITFATVAGVGFGQCGNGILDPNEQCDDGNTVSGDGCNALCQLEATWFCLAPGQPCLEMAVCGDGFVEAGEQCDSGALKNDNLYGRCTTQCKLGPHCGDGIVQTPSEQCDLGSSNGNMSLGANGCTATCMIPHYCGYGIVDTNLGEQCDLGANNGQPGQPCNSSCEYILP